MFATIVCATGEHVRLTKATGTAEREAALPKAFNLNAKGPLFVNVTKSQLALNSIANVGHHFLRLFVAIFMTSFLLSRLGPEVYGIMPLVNSCVAFIVLASGGIQGSVGRYFTLHAARGEHDEANRYASTAFVLLASLIAVMLIPFVLFVVYFPVLLHVPPGHEMESRVVLLLLGINMALPLVFTPYTIGLYTRQRFDLHSLILCVAQIFYVVLVLVSFVYLEASIIYLASATLLSNLAATAVQVKISRQLIPNLEVSVRLFDKKKVKDVSSYSVWVFINQITLLLFLNTDYIIINKIIGSAAVTDYSLAARWNEMVRSVIMAGVGVINPLVTQLEAQANYERLRELFVRGVRFILIIVIPPVVLLSLFAGELLTVWVGSDYLHIVPVFWASLFPLIAILAVVPAGSILYGMGRVKPVAIVNLVSAVANVILSLYLVLHYDLGILGVALGSSIVLVIKSLGFIPFYAARIIKIRVVLFFSEFIRPLVVMIPFICLALLARDMVGIDGWGRLMSASGVCIIFYGIMVYCVVLKAEDKQDLQALLGKARPFFGELQNNRIG